MLFPVVFLCQLIALFIDVSAYPRNDCQVVNAEIDQVLAAANEDFLGRGNTTVSVDGIEQVLYLDWAGYSIPIKFHLTTSNGSIKQANSSRSGDAIFCSGPTYQTLDATVQFDVTTLTYKKTAVKYLKLFSMTGTLSYIVRPTVNIIINQTSTGCSLSYFSLASTGDVTYNLTPDYWFEELVAMRVQTALQDGGDSSPMLSYIQNSLRQFTESFVRKLWCQKTREHSKEDAAVTSVH